MSHREKSLTGWLCNGMTPQTMLDLRAAFDEAFKINAATAYPTRLPVELYKRAEAEGWNMAGYRYELPPDRVPVYLPPLLYEAARAQNFDMTGFAKQQMLPTDNVELAWSGRFGSVFSTKHKLPTSEQMRDRVRDDVAAGRPLGASHVRLEANDEPNWGGCSPEIGTRKNANGYPRGREKQRKHISERQCSGKEIGCLPGRSGSCTACADEE